MISQRQEDMKLFKMGIQTHQYEVGRYLGTYRYRTNLSTVTTYTVGKFLQVHRPMSNNQINIKTLVGLPGSEEL